MYKSAKSKAEAQFTATQRKTEQALKEKELAQQERARHVADLRALRLAKEEADRKAAEAAAELEAAEKKPAKLSKKKSGKLNEPAHLPQPYRHR